ncbi:MAG: beta-lactamase family protein [Deltaproteobacteria bacterium]|nr:beta-lactamase family protein [Deltaproteobacteria bacterium]
MFSTPAIRTFLGSTETATQPEIDGSLHPDFEPVASALRNQLANYSGGAAVCVYHRGQCVVDLWGGDRDEVGRAWQRDTMSPSFSTTKGIASTLMHMMVDRDLADYDDRVAMHWPEFGQAGKERITIRQVLSHQSGLYHIRQMIDRADRMLDWDYMVHAIERTAPIHRPGRRTGYHGLTYGFLVGEILHRITGLSFPDLVERELAVPLGLDGCYVGAPQEQLHRAATLMWPEPGRLLKRFPGGATLKRVEEVAESLTGPVRTVSRTLGVDFDLGSLVSALAPRGISDFDFGAHETLRNPIPAGNGIFTARSLARVYAALAEGGEIDGVRILSRHTLARAMERQAKTKGLAVLPFDMRWRLGYHGIATSRGFSPSAFGHFGFGGSGAWADPSRRLSVAMVVNSGMGTPFGDLRIVRMGGAAMTAAQQRGESAPRWTSWKLNGRREAVLERPNSPRSAATAG